MQSVDFKHTGGEFGTPRNGKYGDPSFDPLWKHFTEGGKGSDAEKEMLAGGRGTTGGKVKSQGSAAPKREHAGFAAANRKAPSSEGTETCNQIRYRAGNYDAGKARSVQAAPEYRRVSVKFEDGEEGCLYLTETKESLEHWDFREDGPRLNFSDKSNEDGPDFERRVHFPILMPSSGRAKTARLDLRNAMQGHRYVQLICVKSTELDDYMEAWPGLCFFKLPESASELGIGASRHWIVELARKICPDEFRFFFMMDDNVQAWKACPLNSVEGGPNSVFSALQQYPLERFQNGSAGQKRDIPLCEVLVHYQADEFRDELLKFGMIGFDRLGRREVEIVHPFARRHVYKAVIFNLDVISAPTNYKERVYVWEDLEFNLRISGRERQAGGGSVRLRKEEALRGGGVWIDSDTKSSRRDGRLILDEIDTGGPAVICKCYHFAYYQDMAIAMDGGCREHQLHPEKEPQEDAKEEKTEPQDLKALTKKLITLTDEQLEEFGQLKKQQEEEAEKIDGLGSLELGQREQIVLLEETLNEIQKKIQELYALLKTRDCMLEEQLGKLKAEWRIKKSGNYSFFFDEIWRLKDQISMLPPVESTE